MLLSTFLLIVNRIVNIHDNRGVSIGGCIGGFLNPMVFKPTFRCGKVLPLFLPASSIPMVIPFGSVICNNPSPGTRHVPIPVDLTRISVASRTKQRAKGIQCTFHTLKLVQTSRKKVDRFSANDFLRNCIDRFQFRQRIRSRTFLLFDRFIAFHCHVMHRFYIFGNVTNIIPLNAKQLDTRGDRIDRRYATDVWGERGQSRFEHLLSLGIHCGVLSLRLCRDGVRFSVVRKIILVVHQLFVQLCKPVFVVFILCFCLLAAIYRCVFVFHFRRIFSFTWLSISFFFFFFLWLTACRGGGFQNVLNEKIVQFRAFTYDIPQA